MEIELLMKPDSNALFWNDDGDCIGDYESLSIYSKDDLVMVIKEINFDNNELKLWGWDFLWNAIIPCESGKISLEELASQFDWKKFNKQGIEFAKVIKKLLPNNVILKYSSPFEDRSIYRIDEMIIA